MDDDLQHEPESIPRLLDQLNAANADLVYGVYDSKKHAGGRNLGSWLVNQFYRLVFRMPVTVTSFRAMRRELVQAILRYDLNFTYIDGLLAWNTRRIEMVTVPHHQRLDGRSGYTFSKLLALAMNVFTNFSLLPLQLVSFVGLLAATGGIGLGSWYLISAMLSQIAVPGYASTIVAVLVLGGLQLLSLGIIGEYIGRLHLNVNRKPQYTIRQVLGCGESSSYDGAIR
jgi:undecaprenyl-phosphate 4-deoxy-4-formamido-L-arabinose transferase